MDWNWHNWRLPTTRDLRRFWFMQRNRMTRRKLIRTASARLPWKARIHVLRGEIFRWAAILFVVGILSGILVFVGLVAWVSRDLPDPSGVRQRESQGTKIVDRHGDVLYDVVGDERRSPIKIEDAPEYLRQATVAVEDKDFYKHGGFDPLTPLRILYNVVVNRRLIGGSTLTQQLVKNALLSNERTLTRKLKEFILALEIERQYNKDEILQMYLNETPYGGNSAGVGAAAQIFFNKDIKELSLEESIVLAGLPQRPSAYSPFLGRKTEDGEPLWLWRASGVARRMREDGYISAEKEKEVLANLPNLQFAKQSVSIQAPHFVFYVQDQLEELLGSERSELGGLRVTTTLDLPFQNEAQKIVKEEIEKVISYKISNGSAMVIDPRNGEILVMVGSKDYFAEDIPGQFNVAVDGLRQPGSSIKPVTYVTALKQGKTPANMIVDSPTVFTPNDSAKPYEPKNYDGKFRGPMSLRRALAESNNIVAVKTLAQVGVNGMLSTAFDLGFKTLEPTAENQSRFGLSVTLGGAEVHLIDTVTAYSSFANGGTKIDPVAILEVTDAQGNVLYKHRDIPGKRVLAPELSFLMNSILSDDVARSGTFGRGSQLNIQNRPIAVKTGTTNDQRDNWTIGWSRSTMVGVWVGNNDNSPMTRVASGITGASPIWRRIMLAAIDSGRTTDAWDVPEGVERVKVDAISGYSAHDELASVEEWVVKGTLPTEPDPIHRKVRLCKGQNKLATSVDVQRGNYDEKVMVDLKERDVISQDGRNRWQEGIEAWIGTQPNAGDYRVPTEMCDSAGEVVVIMKKPENEKNYSETNISVEVETVSEEKIDRVEIWANGGLRETLRDKPYNTTLNLSAGRWTIYAKAIRADGKEGKTGDIRIGTGGVDWKEPAPSPTPTPSPSPSPEASPIIVLPSPTP
jgi:penicillin-binding protein 1C